MALQRQNVPVKISGGIDTKTDEKQVIPGRLLVLENGIYTSLERVKKRNGYLALPQSIENTSSLITQGFALATFKNELDLFTGKELYSFSESTQRWTDKGIAASFSIESKPVVRDTYQQTTCDSAFHPSGLEIFTWEDSSGGSRYSIVDSVTGETITPNGLISANAVKPKPFALGNFLLIFYVDSSTHLLRIVTFAITNPSVVNSTITAATNLNVSNPNYDASPTASRIFFAYNSSAVGGSIVSNFINSFLSLGTPRTEIGESALSCIGVTIDQTLQEMWVTYHNGTQIKYFIKQCTPSLATVLAPTLVQSNSNTINNIAPYADNGNGRIFYTQNASATYNNFIIAVTATRTGVVGSPIVLIRSVGIAAKPFSYNGAVYLTVAFETNLQPTYFVLDTSNANAVAKFSSSIGGGLLKKNIVPEVSLTVPGIFLVAGLQKDLFTTISGASYTQTGVNAISLDFSSPGVFLSTELGENLNITGGITYAYDGVSVVEQNFHIFPENITATAIGSGGNLSAGQYQYIVTYEWMDNQGQTNISTPSVPIQVTTVSNDSVTLVIPTLRITAKKPPLRAPVTINIYRTEADQTIFYKITSPTSPLFNDTTIDTISYTDTVADSAIIGNPLLYTTGGVIENTAPPASDYITAYKDRVILFPSENKNQWWFSKQIVPGSPVEFTDSFVKNVDQAGGDLMAAARLDSVLVLFKQTLIYYVTGTGPDNTGAQDDFSDAQPIACDGGLTDKNSIVLTPSGLMYKSQKGIYLLNRNLSVQYIGAEVELFNSFTVVSSNLIDNTTQVRFCLNNGTALVYDYYVQKWSVFTNHNAVDSVIFQNLFTFLTATGMVLQETPGKFKDNGEFIKLKLTTSWLSFAGLEGFQRVYRLLLLGEYVTLHNLSIQIAYDFNPYSTQASLVLAGSLLGVGPYGSDSVYGESTPYGGAFPLYNFRANLTRQKCSSIQITIEDQRTVGFGENLAISALGFEVGAKVGLNKLPATNYTG